ncbi:hypothetical protein V6N12_027034 [Hibiscus sabdariffa]|uniref:Uncharacterized protein n=1 Tax=Hibiscus sabdariffa TaxID=183260 RepID=A0ABR2DTI6_9ROSI
MFWHPTEPLAEHQTESQTEFQTEPQDEPQIQPPTKPQTDPQTQTEPQAETISEVNIEPGHEPSRFDDTEPDDSQDSDYNGASRTDSVTSSFDDTDFSIEDVSQYHVDVEMDFEGNSRLNRRQAHAQPLRGGALPKLPVKRPFRELATKMQQEVIPLISIQRAIKELQHNHQQSM